MSGKPAFPDDTIALPFIFVPDGQAMPDGGVPAAIRDSPPSLWTLPGSAAPISARRSAIPRHAPVAATEPHDPESRPLLILSAAGAVLAEGSPAQLAAQALRLAQVIPKTHPVFLAAAGSVLAFASVAALMDYFAPMVGDRNAGLPPSLRAHSQRARASTNAVDRDVVDRLDPEEWGGAPSHRHSSGAPPYRSAVSRRASWLANGLTWKSHRASTYPRRPGQAGQGRHSSSSPRSRAPDLE